ncbi:MAG: beta-propeller fold lactonase family protein [Deltaproteobacteria bacterium]|nr:beta-propeller fold lactonase family protein [Deltaproteobacteria bacterium]
MKAVKRCSFVLAVIGFFAWLILPGVTIAADRDWHVTQESLNDAPLKDTMLMYNAGGTDGSVAVFGIPSMRTYRHILCGVDLHEDVFSAPTNEGTKNLYPDGKFLYVNDKAANTLCVINLQLGALERIISFPFPFGPHHITLGPDGKTLYSTGEYTGKMAKVDIATGKWQVIDWGPVPSAPDYLDINKKGMGLNGVKYPTYDANRKQYVFSGNYYHSTVGVFELNPFKLIKEIPVGKNPHGTDAEPKGRYVQVADKLSATISIIDVEKLAVKKVLPVGAGPLHNVFDNKGNAFTSCFVADSIVKTNLDRLETVDEYPVHYRIGHIAVSPDDNLVFALNKFSTGLWSPTGIRWPVNHEMIDINEKSPTYGKTLKIIPVDGEPHNAKVLFANLIKGWTMGEAEKGGLVERSGTPEIRPVHVGGSRITYLPMDTQKPGIVQKGDVKEIHVKAFSYGYVPRQMRVNKGDKVRIIATNIDKAAGITKNPDVIMGFTIYGPYGTRTMLHLSRGLSVMTEFVADVAGEYEIFCETFCGPLHLEMRAAFFVDGPKGQSNLAVGDYDEASEQKQLGLLPGQIEGGNKAVVKNLDQI